LHLYHEERILQYEDESTNVDSLLTLDNKNQLKLLLGKLLFPNKDQAYSNYLKNDLFLANSDNILLKSQIYEIETQYINFPDKQQKSTLLEKLDDILAVLETKLSKIKIPEKIKGKGHPSGTKQLPIALEHMEAEMKKKEN
ncbi:42823_t:CDS:2, partial [Gigaspora margarita]